MHEKRVEIRWRDVDAFGHVNNAVYATYLEECRDEWLDRWLGDEEAAWDFVVARLAIDFRRELRLQDDEVLVRCGLARMSTASMLPEWKNKRPPEILASPSGARMC